MDQNLPQCSHENQDPEIELDKELEENNNHAHSMSIRSSHTPATPKTFSLTSTLSDTGTENNQILIQELVSIVSQPSVQRPTMCQPRSNLQSPISLIMSNQRSQPRTLFVQALNKLNESSLSLGLSQFQAMQKTENQTVRGYQLGEITPPDSLTSAPPSYSFVLRQMAARRRPRLMGTFIPSPSFIHHTPPPTYATAFDIYVDNPMPPPPPRVYHFGFTSMPAVCPECGLTGMTLTTSKTTLCTHMCAFILCLFCCWICAPLPYILRSCKDVYHYCRNCRTLLGMYCPTNPESNFNT